MKKYPRIRRAFKKDAKEILRLVNELANFENLKRPDTAARKRLIEDSFGKNPKLRILVAESDSRISGYAIYFFTYSSFLAKRTLYLEDIFITESLRNNGIGKLFMDELIKIARKNKCGRMEWVVLDWNINAIKFYERLGAKELKEWKTYRMVL